MHPLRIDTLLVDVGGTLVDDKTWVESDQLEGLQLRRLVSAFGGDRPWFHSLVRHRFAEPASLTDPQRTLESVSSFLAHIGVVADREMVEQVCRACAVPLEEVVKLAPDARPAVQAIRDMGLRLVICSNTFWRGDADARRDWEEGFGIVFDAYVTSRDTGFGKPHPAMFERALTSVAAEPSKAAIVGDQLDRDIAGGQAAGLLTIWMRSGSSVTPKSPPDATVHGWAEVPAVIRQWQGT
jgi:HAD superfamily hydrolase (TIGR01509 family)